jgi:CubicO group peptidase (beta-lactamase class C family)
MTQMNNIKILYVLITFCYSYSTFAQTRIETSDKIAAIPIDVDSKIQSLVENGNLPVLQIALISDNKHIWLKTYGKEAKEDVLFKIGSIEKVVTATALLQMHENGQINIYNDINEYLPFSLRNAKFPDIPITVKMLMANRSGLEMFPYQFQWDINDMGYNRDTGIVLPEIVRLSKEEYIKSSLDSLGTNFNPNIWKFKPGSNYQYSNTGYIILQYLIEQVSGQKFSEYVTENIFKRLGMEHSVFSDIDSAACVQNAYTRKEHQNIELPFLKGMYTNAEDMAKFMLAHMNKGAINGISLLKPETIELMHKKHTHGKDLFHLSSNCQNYAGYGLGMIYYGNNIFGHGGSTIGYQAQWSFSKSEKSGYIILTNVNSLLYRGNNFNTVSSIDKLLKSELGYSTISFKKYILICVIGIGIIINILYYRRKKHLRRLKNTPHNNV